MKTPSGERSFLLCQRRCGGAQAAVAAVSFYLPARDSSCSGYNGFVSRVPETTLQEKRNRCVIDFSISALLYGSPRFMLDKDHLSKKMIKHIATDYRSLWETRW